MLGQWFIRVLTWDGLVPVALFVASASLASLVQGELEWIALGLPAIVLMVRFQRGIVAIHENHCSTSMRAWQCGLLVLGLIMIGVFDGVVILSATAPPGAGPFDRAEDREIWFWFAVVYLMCMTIAMYPGRLTEPPESLIDPNDE